MKPGRDHSAVALAAVPLLFLGAFYFYPLFEIFSVSLTSDGTWGLRNIVNVFSAGYYARVLWFTTWQAALSTLLTLVLALPAAYVFARYRFPGKSLIQSLSAIPFVLPSVVVAAGAAS